jgi:hypothetical protein
MEVQEIDAPCPTITLLLQVYDELSAYDPRAHARWDALLDLRLPPGYYVDKDADLLVLRRHDGSVVAVFSARGVAKEFIERAAWEDYGEPLPDPGEGE